MTTEPYSVLGLTRDASYHEVRRAFRRLALESHPDTNGPEGVDRFISVQSAYEAITREKQGAVYGPAGTAIVPTGAGSPPPQPPADVRIDLFDVLMPTDAKAAMKAYIRAQQLIEPVGAVSVLA